MREEEITGEITIKSKRDWTWYLPEILFLSILAGYGVSIIKW